MQIWVSYLHKNGPIRDQDGHLLSMSGPPLGVKGATPSVPARGGVSAVCELLTWVRSASPFTTPQNGDSRRGWIGGRHLSGTVRAFPLQDTSFPSVGYVDLVDPEKGDTYQEGLPVANRAQI